MATCYVQLAGIGGFGVCLSLDGVTMGTLLRRQSVNVVVVHMEEGGHSLPIFDFKCQKCDEVFEAIVKTGDTSAQCPKCGKKSKKDGDIFRCGFLLAPKGDPRGFYKPAFKERDH